MTRRNNTDTNSTLLRQWNMLRAIPRPPRVIGTSDLIARLRAAGYQVDMRTVQRDLNRLAEILPMESDGSKPQGWRWLPNAGQFDIPGLEPEAALAFHMAEAHLHSVMPGSTLDTLRPWFDTARSVLDEHGNGLAKWPGKVRVLPRGLPRKAPEVQQEVQAAVYQAVLAEVKLRITYWRSPEPNEATDLPGHVISPLALVVRDGMIYLVCVFEGYSDLRQLALHRIRSALTLDEGFKRPKDFSIDDYIGRGEFGVTLNPRPIRLEARFRRKLAIYLKESPISDDQVIVNVDEKTILLKATTPDTLELRLWLRSFGDEVTVLKPVALRKEFRAMADRLKSQYAD
jgi:predicted DNA-binding transcriptional regulator YafY